LAVLQKKWFAQRKLKGIIGKWFSPNEHNTTIPLSLKISGST